MRVRARTVCALRNIRRRLYRVGVFAKPFLPDCAQQHALGVLARQLPARFIEQPPCVATPIFGLRANKGGGLTRLTYSGEALYVEAPPHNSPLKVRL